MTFSLEFAYPPQDLRELNNRLENTSSISLKNVGIRRKGDPLITEAASITRIDFEKVTHPLYSSCKNKTEITRFKNAVSILFPAESSDIDSALNLSTYENTVKINKILKSAQSQKIKNEDHLRKLDSTSNFEVYDIGFAVRQELQKISAENLQIVSSTPPASIHPSSGSSEIHAPRQKLDQAEILRDTERLKSPLGRCTSRADGMLVNLAPFPSLQNGPLCPFLLEMDEKELEDIAKENNGIRHAFRRIDDEYSWKKILKYTVLNAPITGSIIAAVRIGYEYSYLAVNRMSMSRRLVRQSLYKDFLDDCWSFTASERARLLQDFRNSETRAITAENAREAERLANAPAMLTYWIGAAMFAAIAAILARQLINANAEKNSVIFTINRRRLHRLQIKLKLIEEQRSLAKNENEKKQLATVYDFFKRNYPLRILGDDVKDSPYLPNPLPPLQNDTPPNPTPKPRHWDNLLSVGRILAGPITSLFTLPDTDSSPTIEMPPATTTQKQPLQNGPTSDPRQRNYKLLRSLGYTLLVRPFTSLFDYSNADSSSLRHPIAPLPPIIKTPPGPIDIEEQLLQNSYPDEDFSTNSFHWT